MTDKRIERAAEAIKKVLRKQFGLSLMEYEAIESAKAALQAADECAPMPKALQYFKPPFHYDAFAQTIYCQSANGKSMCLQVRGWGNLIGSNSLPEGEAADIQDEFGQWVVDILNKATPPKGGDDE